MVPWEALPLQKKHLHTLAGQHGGGGAAGGTATDDHDLRRRYLRAQGITLGHRPDTSPVLP